MDNITHLATGLLVSQLISTPSRYLGAVAGIIFAILPDLDLFLALVDRLALVRYHRGFTHSLIAMPLLALLGAGVGGVLGGWGWFWPLLLLGLAELVCHLLLDLITPYGTQIFFPFRRTRLSLDWVFNIDPYLTGLLLAGLIATLWLQQWTWQAASLSLIAVSVYILVCGFYHHQARVLAGQVFEPERGLGAEVAVLPQPFSCRRWHLIAVTPKEVRQVFVKLPYLACFEGIANNFKAGLALPFPDPSSHAPSYPYQMSGDLRVWCWLRPNQLKLPHSNEIKRLLDIYLEFARFPIMSRVEIQGEEFLLEWLDLQFTFPGRSFFFPLRLHLDTQGHLKSWELGYW